MTRRGAAIELVIVTAGVLIALSVDTVREWRSHRSLAAEARANLLNEIRANKREIDDVLANFARTEADYRKGYTAAENLLAGRPIGFNELHFGFRLAELSAAAYTTAEVTGAFGFMDYDDVRAFSGVYDFQRKYDALQDQSISSIIAVTGPMVVTDGPGPNRPEDLLEWKRRIESAIGGLQIQKQLGDRLSAAYAEVLSGQ